MKPVRLSAHALSYAPKRGFAHGEVEEAILTEEWKPAEQGVDRFECSKIFPFDCLWNGKHYMTKQVRPIFVEEPVEIVVVTVYTYYY